MQVPCQRSRPCKFRAKVVRRIGTVLAKGDIIKEAGGGGGSRSRRELLLSPHEFSQVFPYRNISLTGVQNRRIRIPTRLNYIAY